MYIKIFYFTFHYVYVFVYGASRGQDVHVCAGTHRDWESALNPLELELQLIMNQLMWVLGMCPLKEHGGLFIIAASL